MTGRGFKKLRLRKKLTQHQVACIIGRSVDAVRKWEYGINPVPYYAEFMLKAWKN